MLRIRRVDAITNMTALKEWVVIQNKKESTGFLIRHILRKEQFKKSQDLHGRRNREHG